MKSITFEVIIKPCELAGWFLPLNIYSYFSINNDLLDSTPLRPQNPSKAGIRIALNRSKIGLNSAFKYGLS